MEKINAVITGVGGYVPNYILDNEEMSRIVDTSDEWISQRTGIKERRFEEDSNAHMASYAAIKALENIDYESIDCIIAATYTPDSYIPGLAAAAP